MTTFVDTSAWFAATNNKDRHHQRAIELLGAEPHLTTSTFVLVETWLLLRNKIDFVVAEDFLSYVRSGAARLEQTTGTDLEQASETAAAFHDQMFSLVDRTSFAMMQRLGISRVVSFDHDFVVYRFGTARRQAFEVLR